VVPHKHAGIFISKSKEEALCTKTMFPREFIYGEKRVSVLAVVLHKHANVFISNSSVSNVKNITKTENFRQSTATSGKGNLVGVNSETNRRSVHLNYNYSSDGIFVGDEDMLQKSMKRTA
jgi:hypothetical protein